MPETREYRTIDKTSWGLGPWQDEPDKRQWADQATGLPCLIVRNRMGALCGYVGVAKGHPLYGLGYNDLQRVDVHGGLTFAGGCTHSPNESVGICHVPEPGEPDDVWWFGFDCGHAGDLSPRHPINIPGLVEEYRDFGYVTKEVGGLAAQLAGEAP